MTEMTSDINLVTNDFSDIANSTILVGRLERLAREEVAKGTEKDPCKLITSLDLYNHSLKDMPVYVPGSAIPFKFPNIAYVQLYNKLNSTVSMLEICQDIVNENSLSNLETAPARNWAFGSVLTTDSITVSPNILPIEFNYLTIASDKKITAQIDTNEMSIKFKNIPLAYRIYNSNNYWSAPFEQALADTISDMLPWSTSGDGCPSGALVISELTVYFDLIVNKGDYNIPNYNTSEEIYSDIILEKGSAYSLINVQLPSTIDITLELAPISYGSAIYEGSTFMSNFLKYHGVDFWNPSVPGGTIQILDKYSQGKFSISIPLLSIDSINSFNNLDTADPSNSSIQGRRVDCVVTKAYYDDESNSYTGKYDVEMTPKIINKAIQKVFVGISPLKLQGCTVRFNANPGEVYSYSVAVMSKEANEVGLSLLTTATIDLKDTNFLNFLWSLKSLYTFLGKPVPSIIETLYPSLKTISSELSFNQTTLTISDLKLNKPENWRSKYTQWLEDLNKSGKDTEGLSRFTQFMDSLYDAMSAVYNTFVKSPAGILEIQTPSIIKSTVSKTSVIKALECGDSQKADMSKYEIPAEEYNEVLKESGGITQSDPEQKQSLKDTDEKQQQLNNARNKVDTLQYGTVMQNPASTFSSRMEDLGVQASIDANKMEANEYGGLGTNWINEKIDSPASLRIYYEAQGPTLGPKAGLLESIYVDCFLLQGVQEVDEEKYSIFQSLNGDTLVQFFGRRPTTLNLSGILYDTKNQQWYNDFKYWYDNYLRGSAALKNDSRIVLVYTDQIIEGFILSMSMQKQATTNTSVTVNFTMLVVSHTPLATEWTDPLHSEIPRGFHSKEADKRNQDIIDKNKDFMSSLDTLNFELLADASPDKANYYDNYLKSNTKLGAALEYSSGSSLSSIAFSSKLADVKLNMGVSEVSSDVIATANSNQNAGLAIGSSGISMDSLKLKLNNAEDYARSYRTSQEKSTMDQINFRLSKS